MLAAVDGLELYIKQGNERPVNATLRLTQAAVCTVVRITGGCGNMSAADAARMHDAIVPAFDGFLGAMLFGGTRMIDKQTGRVLPGITEIAIAIRDSNPSRGPRRGSVIQGVAPRGKLRLVKGESLVLHENERFTTIVHPEQDVCLLLQNSVDDTATLTKPEQHDTAHPVEESPEIWDAEWQECERITRDLRNNHWESLLFVWNGGMYTRREVDAIAANGWPVVLYAGSGRAADEYACNKQFLDAHPNVRVVDSVPTLRALLREMELVPAKEPVLRCIHGEST